jgi:hypothetical protein
MAAFEENPAHFATVDDTVLCNLVSSATSKNTHKQIKYAVTILSQYAISVGHSLDIIEAFSKAVGEYDILFDIYQLIINVIMK